MQTEESNHWSQWKRANGLFIKEQTENEQTQLRRVAGGRERKAYPNLNPGTFIQVGLRIGQECALDFNLVMMMIFQV